MRAATEAVRRAPNSSDAWLATAEARLAAQPRTLLGVREALERAIALDPTSAEPHHMLGFTLALLGQDSSGLEHDRQALSIEPARPVTLMHFAQSATKAGRYAEARRWVDSALVFDRDFYLARTSLATLLLLAGDTTRAREEVARWPELPALRDVAAPARRMLSLAGPDPAVAQRMRGEVRAAIPPLLPTAQAAYIAMFMMAASHDAEIVVDVLEAARPRGRFLRYLMTAVIFDPIRSDPRFQRLFQETAQ